MNADDHTPTWRRYLRFWRPDPDADVGDEVHFHIDGLVAEYVAAGMNAEAARTAALRRFGDVDHITRTLRHLSHHRERNMELRDRLESIASDLRFGLRQLIKSPGFTAVAVLTLALGIGANSAIFSVVYSVLLQPLPYANGDRILAFSQRNGANPMPDIPFGNFATWQREANGFEALGAIWNNGSVTLTGQGDPMPVPTSKASAGYWRAMWVPPVLGRYFTEAEDREGGPAVVVLSHALWQNRFNGDREMLGRAIILNGRPRTVIGVAPPDYVLTPPTERVWIPLAPESWRLSDFSDHELSVIGLVRRGTSTSSVVRQLTEIETALARAHPHSGYDGGVIAKPLVDDVVGEHRARLYMLLGAVALVLLIACVNIANLLLARAAVRRGEIAIRGALGATRGRIVSQLLAESLLLGVGGGVLGLFVAYAGTRFLVSSPVIIPRLQNTSVNGAVVAFTFGLAVLCAVVFGLVPALRAARLDLQQTLREGGRDSRGSAREQLRRVLVVSELCIAQVLLIGAGLLIRSAIIEQSVPPGFEPRNVLAMDLVLPRARYANPAQMQAAFDQIESAIAAVPGVRSAGRVLVAPIFGYGWSWTAAREGSNGHDEGSVNANMRNASPSYFATIGVRVVRGRSFTVNDAATGPPVAIVSLGLAKQLWGDADPIGKRITNSVTTKTPVWREVVGVIDDMRASGLREDPPRELYIPTTQWVNSSQTIVVRGELLATTLMPDIRRAVRSIDPLLALSNVSTMEQAIDKKLAMTRFQTSLLGLLGVTGLLLAIVGVYGVIAYFVSRRTHEFGVRTALGASASTLRWMVIREGLVISAIGGAIGVTVAYFAAGVVRTLVFGVTVHDPLTFGGVALLLMGVGVAASYLPARRATRIDPLMALRSE